VDELMSMFRDVTDVHGGWMILAQPCPLPDRCCVFTNW
jgi:hypothetical protein